MSSEYTREAVAQVLACAPTEPCGQCQRVLTLVTGHGSGWGGYPKMSCLWCASDDNPVCLEAVWHGGSWFTGTSEQRWEVLTGQYLAAAVEEYPGHVVMPAQDAVVLLHRLRQTEWQDPFMVFDLWSVMVLNPGLPAAEARRYLRQAVFGSPRDVLPGGLVPPPRRLVPSQDALLVELAELRALVGPERDPEQRYWPHLMHGPDRWVLRSETFLLAPRVEAVQYNEGPGFVLGTSSSWTFDRDGCPVPVLTGIPMLDHPPLPQAQALLEEWLAENDPWRILSQLRALETAWVTDPSELGNEVQVRQARVQVRLALAVLTAVGLTGEARTRALGVLDEAYAKAKAGVQLGVAQSRMPFMRGRGGQHASPLVAPEPLAIPEPAALVAAAAAAE